MENSWRSCCSDPLPPCGGAAQADHCHQKGHVGSSGGGMVTFKAIKVFKDQRKVDNAKKKTIFFPRRSTCSTSPTSWSKVLSCSCHSRPVWRWRSLETWSWRLQSLRWCCSTSTTIGWRPSPPTRWGSIYKGLNLIHHQSVLTPVCSCSVCRPSPDLSWSSEHSMSTTTALKSFWSPTKRPSLSPITSGPHSLMKSGSRWKCNSKISSWLIMAKRTSEC